MSVKAETINNDPKTETTLSRAIPRAAEYLGINQRELADILGISEAQISRLKNQNYVITRDKKNEWEKAVYFYRLYRSLDSLFGDDKLEQLWLRSENDNFESEPINKIMTFEGLLDVVRYLDANRGQI